MNIPEPADEGSRELSRGSGSGFSALARCFIILGIAGRASSTCGIPLLFPIGTCRLSGSIKIEPIRPASYETALDFEADRASLVCYANFIQNARTDRKC